jgi:ABC-type nickel/cobalt efflux system permease component RcnA
VIKSVFSQNPFFGIIHRNQFEAQALFAERAERRGGLTEHYLATRSREGNVADAALFIPFGIALGNIHALCPGEVRCQP